ncbi:sigma 54-interacting transcriptional regulator [Brevibacillus daliensis]|uniref:sigma 54-interacting transcriptional regulator n=1 Tax=Brevibacillus daliensis TaxID=2892995 RepID=UPI001E29228E|nr:sigma 54-interacting transcriptional regulator [Brevibacillus daliensis]
MIKQNKVILVVDDEENVRRLLIAVLKREGYQVETAENGLEALEKVKEIQPDLVLMDIRMPVMDGITAFKEMKAHHEDVMVILMTAYASIESAVETMKLGAYDYIMKPFENDELKLTVQRALQVETLKNEVGILHRELNQHYRSDRFLTNCPKMMELVKVVERVAPSNATVLITGESGTGKEVMANMVHYNSKRRTGPFIKVNCGALSEGLLESELFGHEKGAFTGAMVQKIGRFELASEGTIFLDEIGEISPAMQVKLLRVLQERELERVGGTETIKTNIRIVAATNRNLREMVTQGTFREDLYYRLNVVEISLPPLRERKEDIQILADHFLQKHASENDSNMKGFDPDTIRIMQDYCWPGNLRELSNVIERAVIMATSSILYPEDISPSLQNDVSAREEENLTLEENRTPLKERVKCFERDLILHALEQHDWNRVQTAKDLGISRRSLLYKIEEYQLS